MAILNPGFDIPGAAPGQADHWILVTYTAAESIVGFGPDPVRAWEDFERWFELKHDLTEDDISLAFFDHLAEGFEDFNEGWNNDFYLFNLPTGQVVLCPFSGGAVEDMEDGWLMSPFAWHWEEAGSQAGLFDGEPREDFEESWRNNESYVWDWGMASSSIGYFDSGIDPNEDFDNDWEQAGSL